MKIGLQIVTFDWPGGPVNTGPNLAEIARTADEAGFESLWVMDHFFQMDMAQLGLTPEEPMLDGYTVLGYIAAITTRVRLGTLVSGVIYRHPGHLIKIVSNLDVLSGGRANLGIGAGWYEREAVGLGFPFPPLKERFERLEETLQVAKQMWSGEVTAYHGKHYHLAEPMNHPPPLTKPHPPILIGGLGERKTLRLVAQYGNACNLFTYIGLDEIRRKLDVLKRHCDEVGRPFEEIRRTTLGTLKLGPGGMSDLDVIERCRELASVGIDLAIFNLPHNYEIPQLVRIGREVIPAVSEF